MKTNNNKNNGTHKLKRYGATLALSAVITTTGFTGIIANASENHQTDKVEGTPVTDKTKANENIIVPNIPQGDLNVNIGTVALCDNTSNYIADNTIVNINVPYKFSSKTGKIYPVENARLLIDCISAKQDKSKVEDDVQYNKIIKLDKIDSTTKSNQKVKIDFRKVDAKAEYKLEGFLAYTIQGKDYKVKLDMPKLINKTEKEIVKEPAVLKTENKVTYASNDSQNSSYRLQTKLYVDGKEANEDMLNKSINIFGFDHKLKELTFEEKSESEDKATLDKLKNARNILRNKSLKKIGYGLEKCIVNGKEVDIDTVDGSNLDFLKGATTVEYHIGKLVTDKIILKNQDEDEIDVGTVTGVAGSKYELSDVMDGHGRFEEAYQYVTEKDNSRYSVVINSKKVNGDFELKHGNTDRTIVLTKILPRRGFDITFYDSENEEDVYSKIQDMQYAGDKLVVTDMTQDKLNEYLKSAKLIKVNNEVVDKFPDTVPEHGDIYVKLDNMIDITVKNAEGKVTHREKVWKEDVDSDYINLSKYISSDTPIGSCIYNGKSIDTTNDRRVKIGDKLFNELVIQEKEKNGANITYKVKDLSTGKILDKNQLKGTELNLRGDIIDLSTDKPVRLDLEEDDDVDSYFRRTRADLNECDYMYRDCELVHKDGNNYDAIISVIPKLDIDIKTIDKNTGKAINGHYTVFSGFEVNELDSTPNKNAIDEYSGYYDFDKENNLVFSEGPVRTWTSKEFVEQNISFQSPDKKQFYIYSPEDITYNLTRKGNRMVLSVVGKVKPANAINYNVRVVRVDGKVLNDKVKMTGAIGIPALNERLISSLADTNELVRIDHNGKSLSSLTEQDLKNLKVEKDGETFDVVVDEYMPARIRVLTIDEDTGKVVPIEYEINRYLVEGKIPGGIPVHPHNIYEEDLDLPPMLSDHDIEVPTKDLKEITDKFKTTKDFDIEKLSFNGKFDRYNQLLGKDRVVNYKDYLKSNLKYNIPKEYVTAKPTEYKIVDLGNGRLEMQVINHVRIPKTIVNVKAEDEKGNAINGATFELRGQGTSHFKTLTTGKENSWKGDTSELTAVDKGVIPLGYIAIGIPKQTSETKEGITTINVVEKLKVMPTEVIVQTVEDSTGKNVEGIHYLVKNNEGKTVKELVTSSNGANIILDMNNIKGAEQVNLPNKYLVKGEPIISSDYQKDKRIIKVINKVDVKHPIAIRVIDEEGKPVSHAEVIMNYTNNSPSMEYYKGKTIVLDNTDNNIVDEIDLGQLGDNYIQDGKATKSQEVINDINTEVYTLRVAKQKTKVIVKAVDEKGNVVPNVKVNITMPNREKISLVTDKNEVSVTKIGEMLTADVDDYTVPEGYAKAGRVDEDRSGDSKLRIIKLTVPVERIHSQVKGIAKDVKTGKDVKGVTYEVLNKEGKVLGEFTTTGLDKEGSYFSDINNIDSLRIKSLPQGWILNENVKMSKPELKGNTMESEGVSSIERLIKYDVQVIDEITGKEIENAKVSFLNKNGETLKEFNVKDKAIEYTNPKNIISNVKVDNVPSYYVYKGYPVVSNTTDENGFVTNTYKYLYMPTETKIIIKTVDEAGKDVAGQSYIINGENGKELITLVSSDKDVNWSTKGTPVKDVHAGNIPEGYVSNGETSVSKTEKNGVTTIVVTTPIKRTETNVIVKAVDQFGNQVSNVKVNINDKNKSTLQTVTTNDKGVIAHFTGTPVANIETLALPQNYILGEKAKMTQNISKGITSIDYIVNVIKTSTDVNTSIVDSETKEKINTGSFLINDKVVTVGNKIHMNGLKEVKSIIKDIPQGYIIVEEPKQEITEKNGVRTVNVTATVRKLKDSNIRILVKNGDTILSTSDYEGKEGSNANLKKPVIDSRYELVNLTNNGKVITELPSKFEKNNQEIIYHVKNVKTALDVIVMKDGKTFKTYDRKVLNVGDKLDNNLIPSKDLTDYNILNIITNGVNTDKGVNGVAGKELNKVVINVERKDYKVVINVKAVNENKEPVSGVIYEVKAKDGSDLVSLITGKNNTCDLNRTDVNAVNVKSIPVDYITDGESKVTRNHKDGITTIDIVTPLKQMQTIVTVKTLDEKGQEVNVCNYEVLNKDSKALTTLGSKGEWKTKGLPVNTVNMILHSDDYISQGEPNITESVTKGVKHIDVTGRVKAIDNIVRFKVLDEKGNCVSNSILTLSKNDKIEKSVTSEQDWKELSIDKNSLSDTLSMTVPEGYIKSGDIEHKTIRGKDRNILEVIGHVKETRTIVNIKTIDQDGNNVSGVKYELLDNKDSNLRTITSTDKMTTLDFTKVNVSKVNVGEVPDLYVRAGATEFYKETENGVTTINIVTPLTMKKTIVVCKAIDSKTGKEIPGVKYVISDKDDVKINHIITGLENKPLELKGDTVRKVALESVPTNYHKEGNTVLERKENNGVITINAITKLSRAQNVVSAVVRDIAGDIVIPMKSTVTEAGNPFFTLPVLPDGYTLVNVLDNGKVVKGDLSKLDPNEPHKIEYVVKKTTSPLIIRIMEGKRLVKEFKEVKVKIGSEFNDSLMPIDDLYGYVIDHILVNGVNTGKHIKGVAIPDNNNITLIVKQDKPEMIDEGIEIKPETTEVGVGDSTAQTVETGTEVKPETKDEGIQNKPETSEVGTGDSTAQTSDSAIEVKPEVSDSEVEAKPETTETGTGDSTAQTSEIGTEVKPETSDSSVGDSTAQTSETGTEVKPETSEIGTGESSAQTSEVGTEVKPSTSDIGIGDSSAQTQDSSVEAKPQTSDSSVGDSTAQTSEMGTQVKPSTSDIAVGDSTAQTTETGTEVKSDTKEAGVGDSTTQTTDSGVEVKPSTSDTAVGDSTAQTSEVGVGNNTTDIKETGVGDSTAQTSEVGTEVKPSITETGVGDSTTDIKETGVGDSTTDTKETSTQASTSTSDVGTGDSSVDIKETGTGDSTADIKETGVGTPEISTKDEGVGTSNVSTSETGTGDSLAEVKDEGVGTPSVNTKDEGVGTPTINTSETGTGDNLAEVKDEGVGTPIIKTSEGETQTEVNTSEDSTQTPIINHQDGNTQTEVNTSEGGTQTEVNTSEGSTQTPIINQEEDSTQTEINTSEGSTQTPVINKQEGSTQTTNEMKDSDAQTEVNTLDDTTQTPVINKEEGGTQTEVNTSDSNTQTPSKKVVDSNTQTGVTTSEVETQTEDKIAKKETALATSEMRKPKINKTVINEEPKSTTVIKSNDENSNDLFNCVIEDLRNAKETNNEDVKDLPHTGDEQHNTAVPVAGASLLGLVLAKLFRRK